MLPPFPVPNARKSVPIGLSILGSTGSIGTQTLEIVRLFPDRFRIVALASGSNDDLLLRQALEFRPDFVAIADESTGRNLASGLEGSGIRLGVGPAAVRDAAVYPGVDTVVAAIVGFAGLLPTLDAVEAGKVVALANKETLVVAGALVRDAARRSGATIIPVDSEHSAIFQCVVGESATGIERLHLTASGGPFRSRDPATFDSITRAEALKHPNWAMGAKITIDSATMMNKGLEVIEAHWLFDLPPARIHIVVHPQSIIHSMVEFVDGSTKAQLGVPDMKVPIQYALSFPDRWPAAHDRIDWTALRRLDFEEPDPERFPSLDLAYRSLAIGGTAPAVLNAANEAAVAAFLQDRLRFVEIPDRIRRTLEVLGEPGTPDLDTLHEADLAARRLVAELQGYGAH